LSKSAAARIGVKERGIAPVKVEARPSRQPTEGLRQVVSAMAEAQQNGQRRVVARANTHHLGDQAFKSTPRQRPANSNASAGRWTLHSAAVEGGAPPGDARPSGAALRAP
jgi:rare lipoprotein A